MPARPTFLNVDLDLKHDQPIDGVLRGLEGRMFVLHAEVGKSRGRRHVARLETKQMYKSPDATIREIAKAVAGLSPRMRSAWTSIRSKRLSVGYEVAGEIDHAFEIALSERTIEAAGSMGCAVSLTVYSNASPPAPRPATPRPARRSRTDSSRAQRPRSAGGVRAG